MKWEGCVLEKQKEPRWRQQRAGTRAVSVPWELLSHTTCRACSVPGTLGRALHTSAHLILTQILRQTLYDPHFMDEEVKAQKS